MAFPHLFSLTFILPVFISKFKLLLDGERRDSSEPVKASKHTDEDKETDATVTQGGDDGQNEEKGNKETLLDEDGDLDITRRYDHVIFQQ